MKTFLTTGIVAAPIVAALQDGDDKQSTEIPPETAPEPLTPFTTEAFQTWWESLKSTSDTKKGGALMTVTGPLDASLSSGDGSMILDLAAVHAGRDGIAFAPHLDPKKKNTFTVDATGHATATVDSKIHPFDVVRKPNKSYKKTDPAFTQESQKWDAFHWKVDKDGKTKRVGKVLSAGARSVRDLGQLLDKITPAKFCFRWKSSFAGSYQKEPTPKESPKEEVKEGENGTSQLELQGDNTKTEEKTADAADKPVEEVQEQKLSQDYAPNTVLTAEQNYRDMLAELKFDDAWQNALVRAMNAIHAGLCKLDITEADAEKQIDGTAIWAVRAKSTGSKNFFQNGSAMRQAILRAYAEGESSPSSSSSKVTTKECPESKTIVKTIETTGDCPKDLKVAQDEIARLKSMPSGDQAQTELSKLAQAAEGQDVDKAGLSDQAVKIYDKMMNQCTTCAIVMTVFTFILPIAVASLFILRSASDDDNAKDDEDDDAE